MRRHLDSSRERKAQLQVDVYAVQKDKEGLATAQEGVDRAAVERAVKVLLAEGGELVLGVAYCAALVVDCVLHRAEVDGCKADGDDRCKEERCYGLVCHGST